MTGVINLYKPTSISSSAAVVKVRKILNTKAVGHMGTLDPQAEGVLVLGVGKATRLFDYLLDKDKVYDAEFTFGYETDTLDAEGTTVFSDGKIPNRKDIESALAEMMGEQMQIPPAYSAKKLNGKKAYDMARKGADFELAPCRVNIYSAELMKFEGSHASVRICCSSGTYIRAICRDLAHSLGTYATMTALKRIRCGHFDIEHSVTLDELDASKLLSVGDALPELQRLDLGDEYYKQLVSGVKLRLDGEGKRLVYCKGELFGIGEFEDGRLKLSVYLREE